MVAACPRRGSAGRRGRSRRRARNSPGTSGSRRARSSADVPASGPRVPNLSSAGPSIEMPKRQERRPAAERRHFFAQRLGFGGRQAASAIGRRPVRRRPAAPAHALEPQALRGGRFLARPPQTISSSLRGASRHLGRTIFDHARVSARQPPRCSSRPPSRHPPQIHSLPRRGRYPPAAAAERAAAFSPTPPRASRRRVEGDRPAGRWRGRAPSTVRGPPPPLVGDARTPAPFQTFTSHRLPRPSFAWPGRASARVPISRP